MKNLNWQSEFANHTRDWKIKVMQDALYDLGNPHLKLPNIIHIAGTNGKGSTINFIRTILETAGYQVAMYTSPHLVEYNERFYIGGKLIADNEIEYYRQIILTKCKNADDISYFEASTLIAIMFFADNIKPNGYCLFEVGLGGRLDATNIFDKPLACAITSISLDHIDKLGNTLESIAREKAGIIKHNVPVWCANNDKNVINAIQEVAVAKNAPLFIQGQNYNIDYSLTPSLIGNHQYENATLAKEICKHIGISETNIRNGIANTTWAGRMQKVHLKNIDEKQLNINNIYIDGAHNEGGMEAMCNFVNNLKRNNTDNQIIGIFACLKRKDYMSFLPILSKTKFDKLLFYNVPQEVNDFVPPEELHLMAKQHNIASEVVDGIIDVKQKLTNIQNDKATTIVFFGSLYFIGYIIEHYVNNNKLTSPK